LGLPWRCSGKANQGKKEKGRPGLRWLDDVELNFRNMGVKSWETRALERREWAYVVSEATAEIKGM
jgi:hypothetical protein